MSERTFIVYPRAPLPATNPEWWPVEARDGDRAAVVGRDAGGQLAIAVTQGQHRIELTGSVAQLDRFELPFPTRIGGVTLELQGWRAYGAQDGHLRGASLQFERDAPAATGRAAASLAPDPIAPYFMALQEKAIKGTMYGSVRPNLDFPRLVDLYLDGRLKIDELVSRTYSLDEINEGFAALRSGQVARGVVVFN